MKAYDVALVDPHDPTVEHWPRARVEIEAVDEHDLPPEAPPPNETVEQEAKRIAFRIRDAERRLAIAAYNKLYGLINSHLRYDVVEADPDSPAPVEPERWTKHRRDVGLAR